MESYIEAEGQRSWTDRPKAMPLNLLLWRKLDRDTIGLSLFPLAC